MQASNSAGWGLASAHFIGITIASRRWAYAVRWRTPT